MTAHLNVGGNLDNAQTINLLCGDALSAKPIGDSAVVDPVAVDCKACRAWMAQWTGPHCYMPSWTSYAIDPNEAAPGLVVITRWGERVIDIGQWLVLIGGRIHVYELGQGDAA